MQLEVYILIALARDVHVADVTLRVGRKPPASGIHKLSVYPALEVCVSVYITHTPSGMPVLSIARGFSNITIA